MALIKCKECGHEVSDLANVCPNCGAPIKFLQDQKEIVKKYATIGLILGVGYTIIGVIVFSTAGIIARQTLGPISIVIGPICLIVSAFYFLKVKKH
ncbi:MAG: zinc-ribbon domain-containing protein [Bacteroidales bacterium]|nr:zinc-ribbon domain-containing protein [Bacteroidales bacterium]